MNTPEILGNRNARRALALLSVVGAVGGATISPATAGNRNLPPTPILGEAPAKA